MIFFWVPLVGQGFDQLVGYFNLGIFNFYVGRAEALDLLKKFRQMTSHKAAVVLAILNSNDEMPSAFRAGASFVLALPLLVEVEEP